MENQYTLWVTANGIGVKLGTFDQTNGMFQFGMAVGTLVRKGATYVDGDDLAWHRLVAKDGTEVTVSLEPVA